MAPVAPITKAPSIILSIPNSHIKWPWERLTHL
jgi:hypothetical protein